MVNLDHIEALSQVTDGRPKHMVLKNRLLEDLKSGRLKPGSQLPTEASMAAAMNVARNTVRLAMDQLKREGLIRRVRGKGTFVHESAQVRLRGETRAENVLGLILPDTRSGYYPSLQRGFCDAAEETHNQVIVCSTADDVHRQASSVLQLLDKSVDGIAVVPTTDAVVPAYQIRPVQQSGIPIVFCHRAIQGVTAPLVTFSPVAVGRLAGQALAERGHRRVAFFSTYPTAMATGYLRGLREALAEVDGEVPEEWACYFCQSFSEVASVEHWAPRMEKMLEKLLDTHDRPTGIMASFDTIAEQIYLKLASMGVRTPDDLALIGFGDAWREGAIARELTSVTINEEALGRRAASLLQEIRDGQRSIHDESRIALPVQLYEGRTIGACLQSQGV